MVCWATIKKYKLKCKHRSMIILSSDHGHWQYELWLLYWLCTLIWFDLNIFYDVNILHKWIRQQALPMKAFSIKTYMLLLVLLNMPVEHITENYHLILTWRWHAIKTFDVYYRQAQRKCCKESYYSPTKEIHTFQK